MSKRHVSRRKKSGCLTPFLVVLLLLTIIGAFSGDPSSQDAVTLSRAPAATTALTTPTSAPADTPQLHLTAAPTATPSPEPTATATAKPTALPTATVPAERTYILNKNTRKFHDPSCKSVDKIKEKNKDSFTGTREEVIRMGYDPCGICHP